MRKRGGGKRGKERRKNGKKVEQKNDITGKRSIGYSELPDSRKEA